MSTKPPPFATVRSPKLLRIAALSAVVGLFLILAFHYPTQDVNFPYWRSNWGLSPSESTDKSSTPLKSNHYDALVEASPLDELLAQPSLQALGHLPDDNAFRYYTEAKLRALTACLTRGDCAPNEHKVVIVGWWWCHLAVFAADTFNGGEGIWCRGMIRSLERQGYTVLHSGPEWSNVYTIYRQIPSLVHAILLDYKDDTHRYLKSEQHPLGIPAWKVFEPAYYPTGRGTVVGPQWIVCAEPEWRSEGDEGYRNFTYLGYDLEQGLPYVPVDERPHRVWILGKRPWYFHKEDAHQAWPEEWFRRVTDELRTRWPDFEFVGAFGTIDGDSKRLDVPDGVRDLKTLNYTQFDHELSRSRLMIGLGEPLLSPSPYRGLAMGVPFLNPVTNMGDPAAPHTWGTSQHDTLRMFGEPQIYHTPTQTYAAFLSAITRALETPIAPFRTEYQRQEAVDARMRDLVERDWKGEAGRVLDRGEAEFVL